MFENPIKDENSHLSLYSRICIICFPSVQYYLVNLEFDITQTNKSLYPLHA